MTNGTVLNRIRPSMKGTVMNRIRNLPTADLTTHTPWPQFPRHRGWISVFRNAPSRLVQILGGSR